MRENRVHEVLLGGFEVHCHHEALDEFGDFRAHHVCAEKLAGLLVEHRFDEPVVLAERDRLAVGAEGEAADAHLIAGILRLCFGEAHRGHLRVAIRAAGDLRFVGRVRMQALDRLDADHALVLGLVRQHRRPRDIADGVEARHVGLAEAVDDDAAAIGLHTKCFEAKALDIADDTDRRDHPLGGDVLLVALVVFHGGGDAVRALHHLRHLGRRQDLHALLLEGLARDGGDFRILDRHHLPHHLNDRHLDAHRPVEARKFDPDGARAHYDHGFRQRRRHHGLEIGPDQLAIRLDARQGAWAGAGRDDDVLRRVGARPLHTLRDGVLWQHRRLLRFGDDDFAGFGELRLAPDHVDLVLLHEEANAAIEPLRHAARALHDLAGIRRHRALELEAVVLRVLRVMQDFR